MNGAEALFRTLIASEVDTCFANPGTSEMHFVSALDRVPGVRCVLGLAETIVTGCADGYARMAGKPAATLLHCGPGFANGIANLHNARRAFTPMVNIVGDHATFHRPYDAPLTADTEGLARAVSNWVRTSGSVAQVANDGAAAVQAARSAPGQIATLILPADTAWSEGAEPAPALAVPARGPVAPETLAIVARVLRSREPAILVLSGQALSEAGLRAAQRVAYASGAALRASTQVGHMARGRGRAPVDRIPYPVDVAVKALAGLQHGRARGGQAADGLLRLPGQAEPACAARCGDARAGASRAGCGGGTRVACRGTGRPRRRCPWNPRDRPPELVSGRFSPEGFAKVMGVLLPENCIVAEDGVTSGRRAVSADDGGGTPRLAAGDRRGDRGTPFPARRVAAIACPDRKVVCFQADGAGMYSLQALWTQAREKLDVVNVVFANRTYRILHGELLAVGAKPGRVVERSVRPLAA